MLSRGGALTLNAVAGVLAVVATATCGSDTVPVASAPQARGSVTAPAGMAEARMAPPATASAPAVLTVPLTIRFMKSPSDVVTDVPPCSDD